MYVWKWWRESRNRVIAYLILLVSVAVLAGWTAAALEIWRITLVQLGAVAVFFMGLGLGSSGIGEEFAQGTIEILLTRPRRRRYFVWAGWATGAVEVFIVVALAVLASFVTFTYATKSAGNWRLLTVIVPMFVFGAVVYSLTYFMTALQKNGRAGLSASLGLFVLYVLLAAELTMPWVTAFLHRQINLPTPLDVLAASKWATIPGAHFPAAGVLGWSLVAVAFPLATQFLFERAEV